MTPDKQIEQLDNRVTRLEERTDNEISVIHAKLDALVTAVNKSIVRSVKSECPAPGSCLILEQKLHAIDDAHDRHIVEHTATMLRVERLELRMMALETWQGRILGGITVLMVLLTLFGDNLKNLLRIT